MVFSDQLKQIVSPRLLSIGVDLYLRSHRLYFAAYRFFFGPNRKYLAVAEQNYVTDFPPEWTSVSIECADIIVDLETEYRFQATDVKFAYSSHTIEHLSDGAVRGSFRNLYGSMEVGGVLRVECPDLDLLLDDYKCVRNSDRRVTKRLLQEIERWSMPKEDDVYSQEHIKILAGIVSYFDRKYNMPLPPLCAAEEFQEKITTLSNSELGDWAVSLLSAEQLRNSHEHRNWFGFEKRSSLLTEAGFSDVVRCEPGQTRHGFRMNMPKA